MPWGQKSPQLLSYPCCEWWFGQMHIQISNLDHWCFPVLWNVYTCVSRSKWWCSPVHPWLIMVKGWKKSQSRRKWISCSKTDLEFLRTDTFVQNSPIELQDISTPTHGMPVEAPTQSFWQLKLNKPNNHTTNQPSNQLGKSCFRTFP